MVYNIISGLLKLQSSNAGNAAAAVTALGGITSLICGVYILIILLAIGGFIAVIWAIVDILKAKNDNDWKILWAVVVLLLHLIGVAIYYFVGRKERKA